MCDQDGVILGQLGHGEQCVGAHRPPHQRTAEVDESPWLYQPDSGERRAFALDRLAHRRPTSVDALPKLLVIGPGEPPVTCLPDPDNPLGRRWASLATITCEPSTRTAANLDGTPADIGTRDWRALTADRPAGERPQPGNEFTRRPPGGAPAAGSGDQSLGRAPGLVKWAVMASNMRTVAWCFRSSTGSGQLDNFTPTTPWARST